MVETRQSIRLSTIKKSSKRNGQEPEPDGFFRKRVVTEYYNTPMVETRQSIRLSTIEKSSERNGQEPKPDGFFPRRLPFENCAVTKPPRNSTKKQSTTEKKKADGLWASATDAKSKLEMLPESSLVDMIIKCAENIRRIDMAPAKEHESSLRLGINKPLTKNEREERAAEKERAREKAEMVDIIINCANLLKNDMAPAKEHESSSRLGVNKPLTKNEREERAAKKLRARENAKKWHQGKLNDKNKQQKLENHAMDLYDQVSMHSNASSNECSCLTMI